ncbi:MAG: NUDIX hydrolase [Lachnospiraceae bacterium]|nr:NUDIX hydrolase [Lachnospiraceae bacterium]
MNTKHQKISVAVDVLLFTISDDKLQIVLTKRSSEPFKDMYCLPGVSLQENETPEEAAERSLRERTGLTDIFLEQLYTFGDTERDPRSRTISIAYYALTDPDKLLSSNLNEAAVLMPADRILSGRIKLAFDHKKIIEYGRMRLKGKVSYSDIAFEFVPEDFTLPQLQKVYEILLGEELYKANFRKMISPKVEATGEMLTGLAHRPSRLYRRKKARP